MINSLDSEVGKKNASLDSLNERSATVFNFGSQGTPTPEVMASDKYRRSVSGEIPEDVAVDENQTWTKRDWVLTLGVAAGCLLVFYFLLKYKVITI